MSKKKTPSAAIRKIDRAIYGFSKYVSYVVGAALLIIMLLAFCDVIAAKFFSGIIPSATEWITWLNVAAVFPAVMFVQLNRGHTNVEFLNQWYPPIVNRIFRVFGDLLGAAISVAVAWGGWQNMVDKVRSGEMSSTSALTKGAFPVWPFAGLLSLCCVFMAVAFLWCSFRECVGLPRYSGGFGGTKADEASAAEAEQLEKGGTE